MPSSLPIDASLRDRWIAGEDGSFTAELPDGWAQGRSIFGGLSAAYAVALGRKVADPRRRLRHFGATMMRPMAPGPVSGRVEVLRTGRTTQFVKARLLQDGAVALEAGLTYVVPEPVGRVEVEPPAPPPAPPPDGLPGFPPDDPFAPRFLANVDVRLAVPNVPFRGGSEALLDGYCRFRQPFGAEEGIVALVDIWPCPSLVLCRGPVPASTVTWSLHLLADPPERTHDYFRYIYRTFEGHGGFHTAVGTLYDPAGRAVVHSEQLVAIFDGKDRMRLDGPSGDGGA
ncbi:MAG: thioesterase family protein [Deltaproteobacteria bacterium]|nr:MAG: thioesterase family protein [Deltaproteobacteria bacterium]